MIELLNIQYITEILGYKQWRSVKTWLTEKDITILYLGRNKWILKAEWDKMLAREFGIVSEENTTRQNEYKPKGNSEKKFLYDLQKYLSEVSSTADEKQGQTTTDTTFEEVSGTDGILLPMPEKREQDLQANRKAHPAMPTRKPAQVQDLRAPARQQKQTKSKIVH